MRKIITAIINFFKKIFKRKPKTEIKPEIVMPIKSVDPDKPIIKKPKRRYYQLDMRNYIERNGTIYRNPPKVRMRKKERIKKRWEGKIRFENEKRGVVWTN